MELTLSGWLSAAGLLIGAGMGAYGLINPNWAAWLVRLQPDPARPGGFSEFRGTYGGLFLGAHAMALALMVAGFTYAGQWYAAAGGAALVCAAMWIGTAIGRLISMLADKTAGGFAWASVGFELVLGLLIASPVLEAVMRA